MCMYVCEGMSETSCDRSVVLADYLGSDVLSRLFVFPGPAARISNKYYYANDTFQLVDTRDQGTRYLQRVCSSGIYLRNIFAASFEA